MKTNKAFSILFVLIFALSSLLSACQPQQAVVQKVFNVTRTQMLLFEQYYAETYPLETKYSSLFAEWWAYASNGLSQLQDMQYLAETCYTNVQEVLENGTIGIYDSAQTEEGTGDVLLDDESMISALMVSDLYPANAKTCNDMMAATLTAVENIRQNIYEKQLMSIEMRRTLQTQYDGTVGSALARSLIDTYGVEVFAYINDQLTENGVKPFQADFIGFPSSGLSVSTRSQAWCQYYEDYAAGIENGTIVPDNGMSAQMYGAEWIGLDNGGECHLSRQAAWEFTGRSFISDAATTAVECGEGAPSLSDQPDEGCNP